MFIPVDTKRKAVRSAREQLLTLLNGWDPASLLEGAARRDEYAPLTDELLAMLSRGASTEEVEDWLDRKVQEDFGVTAKGSGPFARKVVTWFEITRREEAR
jgi:hypothetical protein